MIKLRFDPMKINSGSFQIWDVKREKLAIQNDVCYALNGVQAEIAVVMLTTLMTLMMMIIIILLMNGRINFRMTNECDVALSLEIHL
jgi:hypothetical protein